MTRKVLITCACFALLGITIGLAATQSWKLALAFCVFIPFVATVFSRPQYGIFLVTFMIPLESFIARGPGNSLLQLTGLLAFGSGVVHMLSRHKDQPLRVPWAAIWFVVVSFTTSFLKGAFGNKLLTYSMLTAFYWLVLNFIDDERQAKKMLSALVLGSVLSVLLSAAMGGVQIGERFAGGLGDPNDFAGVLTCAVGALIGFLIGRKKSSPLASLLGTVMGFTLILAIMLSYSRGGMLALLTTIIALLWAKGVKPRTILVSTLVAFGLMKLSTLIPGAGDRIRSIVDLSGRGAGRLDIWLLAITQILPRNLILGVGVGNFMPALQGIAWMSHANVAHNMFLDVAVESGIIAFALFLVVILRPYFRVMKNVRRGGAEDWVGLAIFLGLTGAIVAGQFLTWDYEKVLWLMVALADVTQRKSTMMSQAGGVAIENPSCSAQPWNGWGGKPGRVSRQTDLDK